MAHGDSESDAVLSSPKARQGASSLRRPPTAAERYHINAALGRALWKLQYVEDALATYLTMRLKLKQGTTLEKGFAMLADQRKRPFGQLVTEACNAGIVDAEIDTVLNRFVAERNWLVHRSMSEYDEAVYTHEGRESLVMRLSFLEENAGTLQRAVYNLLATWLSKNGFDVDAVEKAGETQYRRLSGL